MPYVFPYLTEVMLTCVLELILLWVKTLTGLRQGKHSLYVRRHEFEGELGMV